jgi:hypothetical protein
MTDSQFTIFRQPDIGFDAGASRRKSGVQRHSTPVIVVGVAALRNDIAAELTHPIELERFSGVWFFPDIDNILEAVVLVGRSKPTQQYGYKSNVNTDVC